MLRSVANAPRFVDAAAIAVLCGIIVSFQLDLVLGGTTVGMDSATAFYPWYSFLGERLRAGAVPAWNPHQFSGMPFAADPESGWMYLPAMLFFSTLDVSRAATAYLLFHPLLAGVSLYALGRTLHMTVAGALVASIAYACNGFLFGHNACCFAYAAVATWLPLTLLGAERSIRSAGWGQRALWWGIAGLGLSQILAAWTGQGAYYAILVLGAYLVYRDRDRRLMLLVDGAGIGIFAVALAAGGLLPRFEFDLLSNLPFGYPDQPPPDAPTWGVIDNWDRLLLTPGFYYAGISVLAVAAAAIVIAPQRRTVLVLSLLGVVAVVLARYQPTPLHAALSTLPGFERLTARSPERVLIVFYLAPALLAGYAVSALPYLLPRWHTLLSALLVVLVFVDLRAATRVELDQAQRGEAAYDLQKIDLTAYLQPSATATYLQAQTGVEPFRYFGYAGHVFGGPMPYTLRWTDPSIVALEVNNRGLLTGLDDVQGYDPIHVARYDHFVAAMNGVDQNYHHTDVFDRGIDSPLLDLLNARFIVFPTVPESDEVVPAPLRQLNPVYQDQLVTVLENPRALPRSWIVHAARPVSEMDAVSLLASGAVDARETALLEEPPPPLAPASRPAVETSTIVRNEPELMRLSVTTDAPGLVVLSEIYYPAWHAYVDGQPVPVYAADGALRAVPVPSGAHEVELRYESLTLQGGLAISLVASAVLAALLVRGLAVRATG